jgi:hypothetical protein
MPDLLEKDNRGDSSTRYDLQQQAAGAGVDVKKEKRVEHRSNILKYKNDGQKVSHRGNAEKFIAYRTSR